MEGGKDVTGTGKAGRASQMYGHHQILTLQLLHIIVTFILFSFRHLADGENGRHMHTV